MMDVMEKIVRHSERGLLAMLVAAVVLFENPVHAEPVLQSAPWSGPLNLWVMDNGIGSQKAVHKLVKKFKRDTGIPVEVRILNWGNAYSVISDAFANPDSVPDFPDVLQLGSTWVPHFASVGKLRVLDTLLTQIDSSRFYTEAFKASRIAGQTDVYSFPWFLDVRTLFANEWLWHTLDIQDSDINDFTKFLGALRAINRGELKNSEMKRVAAFALPGKDDWTGPQQMAPFVWGFGGDFLKCDEGKCKSSLLDSLTLAGLAVYVKILGDEELAPLSLSENSAQNAARFVNSELLIHYGTSELVRQLEYPADVGGLRSSAIADDGIMILSGPEGPYSRSTFVGGSHLALPVHDDSVRFHAAENLLAYLVRADNIDAFCRAVGFLPSDRGLISIWNQDRRYSQIIKSLETGKSFPNIPEWGEIEGELNLLANNIGTTLSVNTDSPTRNREIAKFLVKAHNRMNEILRNGENLDESAALAQIESVFDKDIPEVMPEDLKFEPPATSLHLWGLIDIVVVLVILAAIIVPIGLIVYFVRRKK